MDVARAIASVAAGQQGLFTLHQARELGASDKQLHLRVRDGAYERVGRGVFAVSGVPWSWTRRCRAALLAVGTNAWLSHRAAAHHLGFDGFGECAVELVVPRARRARTDLAIVHTTSALHRLDLVTFRSMPVTSAARTIVDLCAAGVTERQLLAAVGSAVRDGRVAEPFLRRRLAELRGPGRRGVGLVDRALEGPIAHSHLERAFIRLVRDAGLPAPRTQAIMRGERVMRVDALWPDASLVVEVMGHRYHCTAEDLQVDAQRRNELQEMGLFVMELTTDDIVHRGASSMQRLRRTLGQRSEGTLA